MVKLTDLLELRDQYWWGDRTLKKKLVNIFGNFKSSSRHFWWLGRGSTHLRLQIHYEETVNFFTTNSPEVCGTHCVNLSLSRPWSHPVVLKSAPLYWESSILFTRPLLHFYVQRFYAQTPMRYLARLWDPTSFQGSQWPFNHIR